MLLLSLACVLSIIAIQSVLSNQAIDYDQLFAPFMTAVVLIFLAFIALGWRIRRSTLPIDELKDASESIASGNYAVRVHERGAPEIKTVTRAFNAMAARLQEIEDQRQVFFAEIAHELRTPLTVIRGNLEGMLDDVYPRDDEHLQTLLLEIEYLSRLVEDLRLLAMLEAGTLVINKEPTDLPTLLHEVASAFRPQAMGEGISLQIIAPDDFPLMDIDPVRIREVIINLVSNAIRHVPSGGSISLECTISSPDEAQLLVKDTGVGIPSDELELIFERFSTSSQSSGTGLGLPITKRLIEAHNGTLEITSEVGVGTTVEIHLPVS